MKANAVHLKLSQISHTKFSRQSHTIIAAPGQSLACVMEPGAWATLAPKVQVWDQIYVIAEDGGYIAELFVTQASRQWVKTAIVSLTDLTVADKKEDDEGDAPYFVKWRGPVNKWSVVRREDDSNISTGSESRNDAAKVMVEHAKSLAL